MHRRFTELLTCFILSHCGFVGITAQIVFSLVNVCIATDPEPTSSQIAEWASVTRWQFELESVITFDNEPEPSPVRPYVVHRLFAASPSGLYHFTGHDLDRRLGNVSWLQEPFNLETTLAGGTLTSNRSFNRSYKRIEFGPESQLPPYIAQDTLIFVVPVWPVKEYQSPQIKLGPLFVVGEAVKSALYSRMDEIVMVRNEECYVLEALNHCDRICISRNKELCVMQRELIDPHTHKPMLKLTAQKIEQVRPGLWMPVEFECDNFWGLSKEGEYKKRDTTVTRLFNWKFNSEIPDERFVPTIKPGSIEESKDSFHQVHAGGLDHLDEIATLFIANHLPVRYDGSKGNTVTAVVVFTVAILSGYCANLAFSTICKTLR